MSLLFLNLILFISSNVNKLLYKQKLHKEYDNRHLKNLVIIFPFILQYFHCRSSEKTQEQINDPKFGKATLERSYDENNKLNQKRIFTQDEKIV